MLRFQEKTPFEPLDQILLPEETFNNGFGVIEIKWNSEPEGEGFPHFTQIHFHELVPKLRIHFGADPREV